MPNPPTHATAVPPAARRLVDARIDPTAGLDPADAVAFEIGWDHAHHAVAPPAGCLASAGPLRHGWLAGQAVFGVRTLRADRHVRKWLQLRVHAWQRGRAFEEVTVNPAFLRRIDVARCPITRETLTHATGAPSDGSVDRVRNDAGYAAGNLAVMSTRANRAKAGYGCDDAMSFVRQIELGRLGHIDGLGAAQWARVAVLAAFVTPLPHARAATLPLLVLPPARLRVLNPVQSLQVLASMQFLRPGHARRGAAIAALMPSADARRACDRFLLTFLARRLAASHVQPHGTADDAHHAADERERLGDLWHDALLQRRWRDLALRLGPDDCERVVERALARGLAGPALRWLGDGAATDGWAIETRGYVGPPPRGAPPPASTIEASPDRADAAARGGPQWADPWTPRRTDPTRPRCAPSFRWRPAASISTTAPSASHPSR